MTIRRILTRGRTAPPIFVAILVSLLLVGGSAGQVSAASCVFSDTGDVTLTTACTIDGTRVAETEYVHGAYNGNITVGSNADVTIQPNTTMVWPEGNSITIQDGGKIFIGSGSQIKQTNLHEYIRERLGFSVYAAGTPVRVLAQNLFVCTSDPCTATEPSGTGNLVVEGVIKMTGGSPGAGKVLTSDANGEASWQTASGIPSGMIAAFASDCPTGWTEYTAARGRYIVGVPSGGTVSGTVGTALTNLENRAVGQHYHSVDPGSTASSSEGSHTHSIDPPSTATNTTGSHTHQIPIIAWGSSPPTGADSGRDGTSYSINSGAGGNHAHTLDIAAFTSGAGSSHSHTVDIAAFNSANSGSVAGTNAPYIQARYCVKD